MTDETYHEALHPLFVTSKAVTSDLIDELLQRSADNVPIPEEYGDLYAFTLQRDRADAAREKDRVASGGHPMRGTRPPVGAASTSDFEGMSVDGLARYVLETFAIDEVERQGSDYVQTIDPNEKLQKSATAHINNQYFAVLDERSTRDKSFLLVYIPTQGKGEGSGELRYTRNWVERTNYTDLANWENDDADDEMKAVRLAFNEGYRIDMCQSKEESIEEYARQADGTGVFSEESAQEYFQKIVAD